jgi:hypothetical protein
MISLRIRIRFGGGRQAIAKQCGTSVDTLERNYLFAIEDLEDEAPGRPPRSGSAPGNSLLPTDLVTRGCVGNANPGRQA